MNDFKPQWKEKNVDSRPHIVNVMNFTRATDNKPALLTYDEVETFLHEFGHGLHGMLTRCQYSYLSGTNVPRDFVELPSQFPPNFIIPIVWSTIYVIFAIQTPNSFSYKIVPEQYSGSSVI